MWERGPRAGQPVWRIRPVLVNFIRQRLVQGGAQRFRALPAVGGAALQHVPGVEGAAVKVIFQIAEADAAERPVAELADAGGPYALGFSYGDECVQAAELNSDEQVAVSKRDHHS